jgi:hypothetical protein
VEALNGVFFIGLQEAYDISVEMLIREFKSSIIPLNKHEREAKSKKQTQEKNAILNNEALMTKAKMMNSYDIKLYELGTSTIYILI